jgi:hypothetical protein
MGRLRSRYVSLSLPVFMPLSECKSSPTLRVRGPGLDWNPWLEEMEAPTFARQWLPNCHVSPTTLFGQLSTALKILEAFSDNDWFSHYMLGIFESGHDSPLLTAWQWSVLRNGRKSKRKGPQEVTFYTLRGIFAPVCHVRWRYHAWAVRRAAWPCRNPTQMSRLGYHLRLCNKT